MLNHHLFCLVDESNQSLYGGLDSTLMSMNASLIAAQAPVDNFTVYINTALSDTNTALGGLLSDLQTQINSVLSWAQGNGVSSPLHKDDPVLMSW